ncbi:MAG TPA: sulfur transferase domain-containing protein [Planctomycetota bacterium]|jgi:uncharacterized protein (TIGR01244 family)|nr:sulfur transferase domain-containing protein [Planctomycetota bacterium]HJM39218.1 sulfur transferase domain-containing protein [Planctomycetota bacterium]|tara:strand:- start:447 stop:1049 length:603 start_codon:yes stop_codon:yes gene_type:complete
MRYCALPILPLLLLPACSLWDGIWGEDGSTEVTTPSTPRTTFAEAPEILTPSALPNFVDIHNFVIMSETVAGSGQPGNDQYAELATKGYTGVVNLCPSSEAQPEGAREAANAAGLHYAVIPVTSESLSIKDAHLLSETLARSGSGSVLVHCRSGNRAGALWGIYRGVTEGLSVSDAVLAAKDAGMRSPALAKLVAKALTY